MLGKLLVVVLLATSGNVTIDAVYPNPATSEDVGEFVVLEVPPTANLTNATLTDGEETVSLDGIDGSDRSLNGFDGSGCGLDGFEESGRVVVTDAPALARELTDLPVYRVDEFPSLRNGGEWVAVDVGDTRVSNVTYPRAPEAELYRNGTWEPIGRTNVSPRTVENVTTTALALPDDPSPILETLRSAEERIYLAGYTITAQSVVDALLDAHRDGVDVAVLLEEGPVGGITEPQVRAVDQLKAAGVPVDVMGTDRARYRFHHAKYAVVDDQVVVTTENWKPGGIGGHGSRGWGVVLEDRAVASTMAEVFEADAGGIDAQSWNATRPADPVTAVPDTAIRPTRFAPLETRADRVTILLAPDNAAAGIRSMIRGAEESVWVQQVSIQEDGLLMNETLAAARRGVTVRILVSGAWFVAEENRKFVSSLRAMAEREDLPIEATVVEPRGRFEYVHAKGLVVDGRSVAVGSLNWNDQALSENREVVVRVEDPAIGSYYRRTFLADWRGAAWRVQWSLLAICGGVLVVGIAMARRVRFE